MRPPWVPRTINEPPSFGLLRSFYHSNSFARLKATQTGFVERDGALAARSIAAQARHWGETLHESITITMSTLPPPGIAVGEELREFWSPSILGYLVPSPLAHCAAASGHEMAPYSKYLVSRLLASAMYHLMRTHDVEDIAGSLQGVLHSIGQHTLFFTSPANDEM